MNSSAEPLRVNAIQIIDSLLAVSVDHESKGLIRWLREVKGLLEREDIEAAIAVHRDDPIDDDESIRWTITRELLDDLYESMKRLRVVVTYGARRDPLPRRPIRPIQEALPRDLVERLVQVVQGEVEFEEWVRWRREHRSELDDSLDCSTAARVSGGPKQLSQLLTERGIAHRLVTRPLREVSCPGCQGRAVIPIVYGLPGSAAMDAADEGLLRLGGCCPDHESPAWYCQKCETEWGDCAVDCEEYRAAMDRILGRQ